MTLFNPSQMILLSGLLLTAVTGPSMAQEQVQMQQQAGQVEESPVGKAGQRETRERNQFNSEPMTRINSRIPTRVQNRIRSRIDRYYDPQANAISPFEVAAGQARTATSRPQR